MPVLAGPDAGTLTNITLVSDSDSLVVQPVAEVFLQNLDLGFPTVREVVEPQPGADGTRDLTSLHGSRPVSLELILSGPDRLRVLDDLRSFCHPSARPYLVLDSTRWDQPRRIRLRVSQQTAPMLAIGQQTTTAVQLQWVAPDGVLEAVDESQVTVPASGRASAGISSPFSFPVSMPAGVFSGIVAAQSFGSTFSDPVVAMYGPCTAPVLSCDGQGFLSFPSLTISAGDYVEVDFRNHTARYNGLADASRLRTLDFATATWWRLARGINTIRYTPASYGDAAAAVVTWRDSWI